MLFRLLINLRPLMMGENLEKIVKISTQNCWSAWTEFCLFTSFWRWFSLALRAVSDLSGYCLLHNIHFITYIKYFVLKLSLLDMSKALFVAVLLKVFVSCTCAQYKLPARSWKHLSSTLICFCCSILFFCLEYSLGFLSSKSFQRRFCKNLLETYLCL